MFRFITTAQHELCLQENPQLKELFIHIIHTLSKNSLQVLHMVLVSLRQIKHPSVKRFK